MVKKQTKQKNKAAEPTTAPHLSPTLLKEWTRHTEANTKAAEEAARLVQTAGEIAVEETTEAVPEPTPTDDIVDEAATTEVPQPPPPAKDAELDELDTPENDEAVDDILLEEGNDHLRAEEAQEAQSQKPRPQYRGFWRSIGHFFVAWWRNGWARWLTILFVLAAAGTLGTIPTTRYAILNTCGVRASVSLTVMDSDTRLPLKNVTVMVDGQKSATDITGNARVEHVRLGPHMLEIKRFGFTPLSQRIVVGWGSNPLDQFFIKPVGAQYKLTVRDYVSGLPIKNAEANSGLATAVADKNGVITLTMDINTVTADLNVQAKGYRAEKMHIDLNAANSGTVNMVPTARAVFVDHQTGSYDLVAMQLDGKNRQVLLSGTATQTANIALAPDPTNSRVAMVSTRDNVRNSDGFLLSTLSIVGINEGGAQTVAHAEQIKLIDWIGTKLIFMEAVAGPSASNSQRYKIVAYDYTNNSQIQLATANQFNAVLSMQGQIYYAPSSTDPTVQPAFIRVKPDGSARQTVLNQEAWAAFRASFAALDVQTSSGWFAVAPGGTTQKINAPATFQNRSYASNGSYNLWVDLQHPGALLNYDQASSKDKTLHTQTGINYPLYWLNDQTAVYRLADGNEVADYAVSAVNGHTKKIADVFGSVGLGH